MNNLYRTKPSKTVYTVALKEVMTNGQTVYHAQECDRNGKVAENAQVITLPAEKFEQHYEPVQRRTKEKVSTN